MIIHARFLIKTCHHASHFYALSKHNYLCICLEIFLSKCKPLARVNPIIYRPLTNWCESPCKKKPFLNVGITKIKWVEEWHGQNVEFLFSFVCNFLFFLLLKWTISSFNKTEKYFQHSLSFVSVTHQPSPCLLLQSMSFCSSKQFSARGHIPARGVI